MAAGGSDALDGGQAGGHEVGYVLQGLALDDDQQVEAAAHEVHGAHLVEAVDALGDGIKAHFPLGGQVDLDDGGHRVVPELLPVDEGIIGKDDLVLFQVLDVLLHFVFAALEHGSQLADGAAGIMFQEFQQFSHKGTSLCKVYNH